MSDGEWELLPRTRGRRSLRGHGILSDPRALLLFDAFREDAPTFLRRLEGRREIGSPASLTRFAFDNKVLSVAIALLDRLDVGAEVPAVARDRLRTQSARISDARSDWTAAVTEVPVDWCFLKGPAIAAHYARPWSRDYRDLDVFCPVPADALLLAERLISMGYERPDVMLWESSGRTSSWAAKFRKADGGLHSQPIVEIHAGLVASGPRPLDGPRPQDIVGGVPDLWRVQQSVLRELPSRGLSFTLRDCFDVWCLWGGSRPMPADELQRLTVDVLWEQIDAAMQGRPGPAGIRRLIRYHALWGNTASPPDSTRTWRVLRPSSSHAAGPWPFTTPWGGYL